MTHRADHIQFDDVINIDMNRAMRRVQRLFLRTVLQPAGLSLQEWRGLLNLSKFGPCHLRELARVSSLDPTPLGKAVVALETRALLVRRDDPEDARRKQLDVTAKGQALVDAVWPRAVAFSGHVRQQIGAARYDALRQALKQIQTMEAPASDPH